MGNRFSSGKNAISQCDRCDFRYPLKQLRRLIIKTKNINMLVCPTCWDPDHPQLQLGMYPVEDPQAVRDPRPDRSYFLSGTNGLQITDGPGVDGVGSPDMGSRIIQWGWNPVGLDNTLDIVGLPNNLVAEGQVGTVLVNVVIS